MPVAVGNHIHDSMKEACARLAISRQTMLRYIDEGFFTQPPRQKQRRAKSVRYFTAEWYSTNEARLREARGDGE